MQRETAIKMYAKREENLSASTSHIVCTAGSFTVPMSEHCMHIDKLLNSGTMSLKSTFHCCCCCYWYFCGFPLTVPFINDKYYHSLYCNNNNRFLYTCHTNSFWNAHFTFKWNVIFYCHWYFITVRIEKLGNFEAVEKSNGN